MCMINEEIDLKFFFKHSAQLYFFSVDDRQSHITNDHFDDKRCHFLNVFQSRSITFPLLHNLSTDSH